MTPKFEEVVEYLRGTCQSLSEACAVFEVDEDSLSTEDYDYLDEEIFRCEECSWWYSMDELSQCEDDPICTDCYEGM